MGSSRPLSVRGTEDIAAFFDGVAQDYQEQHGKPQRLLEYRLGLIRKGARFRPTDVVLDIGCGPGNHLLPLLGEVKRGIGVDLSAKMIELANDRLKGSASPEEAEFHRGNAERLDCVADASVDVALCVGALEHMVDKASVLANVRRVLAPGGRFVCLTPDGGHLWYRRIADLLGKKAGRLSTDLFLTKRRASALLADTGFERFSVGHWAFIPKGDMGPVCGWVLDSLSVLGSKIRVGALQGGLVLTAEKAASD